MTLSEQVNSTLINKWERSVVPCDARTLAELRSGKAKAPARGGAPGPTWGFVSLGIDTPNNSPAPNSFQESDRVYETSPVVETASPRGEERGTVPPRDRPGRPDSEARSLAEIAPTLGRLQGGVERLSRNCV